MLTRRHLRIKVMQSLYSLFQNEEKDLDIEINFFKKSVENTFSLFFIILSIFRLIHQYANDQVNLKKKFRNISPDKRLNSLLNNKILIFFSNNREFLNFIKKRKIKLWQLDFIYLKSIYDEFIRSNSFEVY